jgi:hypothetical protein
MHISRAADESPWNAAAVDRKHGHVGGLNALAIKIPTISWILAYCLYRDGSGGAHY